MAFERCRLGWFEACSRKPTSKGLPSSSIQLRKPDGLAFVTHDPFIFYFDILGRCFGKWEAREQGIFVHAKLPDSLDCKANISATELRAMYEGQKAGHP